MVKTLNLSQFHSIYQQRTTMITPIFKQPESNTTKRSFYDLQDTTEFTPVVEYIYTHTKDTDTGSTATRWGITEDNQIVVQRASVIFGEAETLQEGLVDLTEGFKMGGEASDLVYTALVNQGAMFEIAEGLGNTFVAPLLIDNTPVEVWYKPQTWISIKAMPANKAQKYIDLNGHEVYEQNVGKKSAKSLFGGN